MTDTTQAEILAFYRTPVAPNRAPLFDALPDDVAALAKVPSGLVLHQYIGGAYGETISHERAKEVHIRPLDDVIATTLRHDPAPLRQARPPSKRTIGNCRDFTLLLVAMLRHKNVPARARCGFAAYFEKDRYVDHWVAEYWDGQRWVRVDAQLDEIQRRIFHIGFDPLDVPHDAFLIAGDAWKLCRDGNADPRAFGIMDMNGWWFVAGNIVRDIAALNNRVMLPWDVWGEMPQPGSELNEAQVERFDDLAALTRDPDRNFGRLRSEYKTEGLNVPPVVFNAVLQRPETV
ncbi:MAG TPA: transglutaminase-like domain-containing protein [Rhizomicrobium sp.]|nr:transglutaminase-like domain-containing protein [Rhizomicrobium sp.]